MGYTVVTVRRRRIEPEPASSNQPANVYRTSNVPIATLTAPCFMRRMDVLCPIGICSESDFTCRHGYATARGLRHSYASIELRNNKRDFMSQSLDNVNNQHGSLVPSQNSSGATPGGLEAYFRSGMQLMPQHDFPWQHPQRQSATSPADRSTLNSQTDAPLSRPAAAAMDEHTPAAPRFSSSNYAEAERYAVVDWRRRLTSERPSCSAEDERLSLMRSQDSIVLDSTFETSCASDDDYTLTRRSSTDPGGSRPIRIGSSISERPRWMLSDPVVSPCGATDTLATGTKATCSSTPAQPDAPPSRHLWLGNLAPSLPRHALLHLLEEYGHVEELVTAPGSTQALVTFTSMSDAMLAKKIIPRRSTELHLAPEVNQLLVQYRAAPRAMPMVRHCSLFLSLSLHSTIFMPAAHFIYLSV
jgi:hypothetical protein